MRGFYFITDRGLSKKPIEETVREALEGGAAVVQYRDKDASIGEKAALARRLRLMTSGRALFFINDELDLAQTVGADGVHLGQGDMSVKTARYLLERDMLIGVTVHSIEEAKAADAAGADYVAVSPVFATATKGDAGEPVGAEMIRRVKAAVKMPVCAIGGINEGNIDEVIAAGADMACAISATVGAKDIRAAVKYFAQRWKR